MKISTVLIGAMLLATGSANAQVKEPIKKVENDSIKHVKRLIVPARVPVKKKVETTPGNINQSDTLNHNPNIITKDYCPPCGMG